MKIKTILQILGAIIGFGLGLGAAILFLAYFFLVALWVSVIMFGLWIGLLLSCALPMAYDSIKLWYRTWPMRQYNEVQPYSQLVKQNPSDI